MVPYIRVKFVESTMVTYMNPAPWACLKFGDCSYLHSTKTVSWSNLTDGQTAIFYESEKCVAEGQFHYISDKRLATGAKNTLKKHHLIRSMMVGESSEVFRRPTITYLENCLKESAGLNDVSVNITWGGYEKTMSNWNDELREASLDDDVILP